MNVQSQNMMPNSVTQNIANMNKQNPNMIPNAVTQLPELFVGKKIHLKRKLMFYIL